VFRLTAQRAHPSAHIQLVESISLPPNGQSSRESRQAVLEADPTTDPPVDVNGSLPLDLFGIGTRQLCYKGQKALTLLLRRLIIEPHGQAADWAREAGGHLIDTLDRLVGEPCRDDGGFVDAGAAVLAGERV
jgi:hypothetical protein